MVGPIARDALLGRDYWLVWSTPGPQTHPDAMAALIDDHLDWLLALESTGSVLMSGPLLEGPEIRPGAGVTVLRAAGADQATDIAATDPFVVAGLRTFEVFRWRVNEGTVGVTISLGTGTYQWQ